MFLSCIVGFEMRVRARIIAKQDRNLGIAGFIYLSPRKIQHPTDEIPTLKKSCGENSSSLGERYCHLEEINKLHSQSLQ